MLDNTLKDRMDIISAEELYPAAESFSDKLPRLTPSQINGLRNMARCGYLKTGKGTIIQETKAINDLLNSWIDKLLEGGRKGA